MAAEAKELTPSEAQDLLGSSTVFKLKFIEELLLDMAITGGTELSGEAFQGFHLVMGEVRREVEQVIPLLGNVGAGVEVNA